MQPMEDGGERMTFEGGALREPATGKGRYDLISPFALERLALWYEAGAAKYAPRNWEAGMSYSRLIDSACRHINRYRKGERGEDHLAAAVWNLCALMHYQACHMDQFDDLPTYPEARKAEGVNIKGECTDEVIRRMAENLHKMCRAFS